MIGAFFCELGGTASILRVHLFAKRSVVGKLQNRNKARLLKAKDCQRIELFGLRLLFGSLGNGLGQPEELIGMAHQHLGRISAIEQILGKLLR